MPLGKVARRDKEQGEAAFKTVAKVQELQPAIGNVVYSSSTTPATYTNLAGVTST